MSGPSELGRVEHEEGAAAVPSDGLPDLNLFAAEVEKLAGRIDAADPVKADIHLETLEEGVDFRTEDIPGAGTDRAPGHMDIDPRKGAGIQCRHQIVGDDGQPPVARQMPYGQGRCGADADRHARTLRDMGFDNPGDPLLCREIEGLTFLKADILGGNRKLDTPVPPLEDADFAEFMDVPPNGLRGDLKVLSEIGDGLKPAFPNPFRNLRLPLRGQVHDPRPQMPPIDATRRPGREVTNGRDSHVMVT